MREIIVEATEVLVKATVDGRKRDVLREKHIGFLHRD